MNYQEQRQFPGQGYANQDPRKRIIERSMAGNTYLAETVENALRAADLIYVDDLIEALNDSLRYKDRVRAMKRQKVAELEAALAEAKKDAGI